MTTEMEQAARKSRTSSDYIRALDDLTGAALALDNDDGEAYDLLCKIIVQADAGWRCNPCGGINYHSDITCNNCRARKPKARTIPKAESYLWTKGE
jgi:hypothetical protein